MKLSPLSNREGLVESTNSGLPFRIYFSGIESNSKYSKGNGISEKDSSAKACCCPQYAIPTTLGTENVHTTSMDSIHMLATRLNLTEFGSASKVLANTKPKTGIKSKSVAGLFEVGTFNISMIGIMICSFVNWVVSCETISVSCASYCDKVSELSIIVASIAKTDSENEPKSKNENTNEKMKQESREFKLKNLHLKNCYQKKHLKWKYSIVNYKLMNNKYYLIHF